MEKIFDLRFIVPPLITIVIVCAFIQLINPTGISFLLFSCKRLPTLGSAITFAFILALGFVISSVSSRLRNRFLFPRGEDDYNKNEQEILKQNYPWIGDVFARNEGEDSIGNINCEIAEMEILNKRGEYTQKYLDKTWNLSMASFNSFFAIILGLLIIIIYNGLFDHYILISNRNELIIFFLLLILLKILLCIFWYSGKKGLSKIYKINRALVRKLNKMKNVLILHGAENNAQGNWFPWLKQELEKQCFKVWAPNLPNSETPIQKDWLDTIFSNPEWQFNEESIIIGHSAGATLILRILENLPKDLKINKAILVAGFANIGTNPDFFKYKESLVTKSFDWKKIKDSVKNLYLICSDNDPYQCGLDQAKIIEEHLGGTLILKPREGHFNLEKGPEYKQFPLLLETIKT